MEALDHPEVCSATPQSLTQEAAEYQIANSGEPDRAQNLEPQPSIREFVYAFLNNVKSRFGENSLEVTSIWNALSAFGAGKASKKDTLIAINLILSHHNDLKQDLMNVLYHPEAKWHVEDFEFESHEPNHVATPQFLQPAHQPPIRLPPISWIEDKQATEPAQSLGIAYSDSTAHRHKSHSPQATFRETPASEATSLSVPDFSVLVPADQFVDDTPLPTKKRRCEAFVDKVSQFAIAQGSPNTANQVCSSNTNTTPPAVQPQPRNQSKAKQSQRKDRPKLYIHSLCGKGFSARSKVKKHHWGNVLDNLETTTGCWAKHGKPNVSWNEHLSCREGSNVSSHANVLSHAQPVTPITKRKRESQETPEIIPPMALTVQELPEPVACTSNIHEEYQDASQGTDFHHSHRAPHRSSFDNLLSAVNLASQIDAPQPQGRIDSVVFQLDAQATAAEHNRQYVADWQNAFGDYRGETVAYGYHHPYTTVEPSTVYPLRGCHVPLEIALPFYGRPQAHTAHTAHMYHPTTGNWVDDPASMFDEHSSRAPLEPFSPDPYVGSRRA